MFDSINVSINHIILSVMCCRVTVSKVARVPLGVREKLTVRVGEQYSVIDVKTKNSICT